MLTLNELEQVLLTGLTVLEVARALLQTCRQEAAALSAGRRRKEGWRVYSRVRSAAIEVLRRSPSSSLDTRQRRRLVTLLRLASRPPGGLGLAARALAEALDQVVGPRFIDCFRARQTWDLREGEAFPVAHPPLRRLLGTRLSARPESLGEDGEGLHWLRLMPPLPAPFQVRLSFESGPSLAAFEDAPRLGFGFLNTHLDEFHLHRLPDWPQRFFPVLPRDMVAQRARLEAVLEQAERAGVTVLLLPELCLTPELMEVVRQWYRSPERGCSRLSLLVAGSFHEETHGRRANVCLALGAGHVELRHEKFNPFCIKSTAEEPELCEALDPAPFLVTIHWSGSWSFTQLICKDFLHPQMGPLLATLRPSLVLCPAMSQKLLPFQTGGEQLATVAQSMLFVANVGDGSLEGPTGVLRSLPTALRPPTFLPAPEQPLALLTLELSPSAQGGRRG